MRIKKLKDNIEIKFYTNEEIEKLINEFQTERLVFIDDGIDEVIGRFKDLPNIIVDLNRKFGSKDLKIRNFIEPEDEPIIETFGMFLHKISPEDREEIIEELNKLQQYDKEISDYKLITIEDLAEFYKSRDKER